MAIYEQSFPRPDPILAAKKALFESDKNAKFQYVREYNQNQGYRNTSLTINFGKPVELISMIPIWDGWNQPINTSNQHLVNGYLKLYYADGTQVQYEARTEVYQMFARDGNSYPMMTPMRGILVTRIDMTCYMYSPYNNVSFGYGVVVTYKEV